MSRIALTVATLTLLATQAYAQRDTRESPRSTYVELRVGFYKPEIDSEFNPNPSTERPYEAIFDDKREALFQLVLERQFFQRFGTLSGGLGAGYWSVEGDGLAPAGSTASDPTEMIVVPLQAQVTYRFDYFEDFFPLVPVVRGGLDYFLWEVLDGSDEVARFSSGDEAKGGTWGWHYTLGVHLLLDALAPDMAADFDRDAGVNGSYVTFEYQRSQVDDFGSSESFRLGDGTFFIGLTLDI